MICVRLAKPDDGNTIACLTASIQQLHNSAMPDLFRPPHAGLFPLEKLSALLKDSSRIVAVAETDGEIAGHIYGEVMRPAASEFRNPETSIYVHQIGVREDYRGRGIGTALLGFMEERATAIGASSIGLDYWAFNARARSFFEARGFSTLQVKMRKELRRR
jgi:ribosomal protein S18 acetylase RimI-like enzyme